MNSDKAQLIDEVFLKKSIILIMPIHFKIYKAFVANLEQLGFTIDLVFTSSEDFRYSGFSEKVINFVRKNLLRDKVYKENLKKKYDDQRLKTQLLKFDKQSDYALVIRPDYFSRETLQLLKSKVNRSVAYQWDGLDRYPEARNTIDVFDRFYLFDIDDYARYKTIFPNVLPLTNFYFDIEMPPIDHAIKESKKEVFFIGSLIESRLADMIYIAQVFNDLNFNTNIKVLYFTDSIPSEHVNSHIRFIKKPLDYLDVLEEVQNADVLLDFLDTVHNGLSFRVFEALKFSKKLITNNQSISSYDFYSPNNILIWDQSIDKDRIAAFLKNDYEKIDDSIIQGYSFSSWINNILN